MFNYLKSGLNISFFGVLCLSKGCKAVPVQPAKHYIATLTSTALQGKVKYKFTLK